MNTKEAPITEVDDQRIIIDGQLYEVDKSLLKKISKKVEPKDKPKDENVSVKGRRHWTEAEINLLGQSKDGDVSSMLNVSITTVAAKRRELGIAPFTSAKKRPRRKWSKKEISLLGTISDTDLANQLGLSVTTIGNKRREYDVRKYCPPGRDWKESEIELLGTMHDNEVADKLQIPKHIVYLKRRDLKVQAFNRTPHEDEAPKPVPELSESEKVLADEVYSIYEGSFKLVKVVSRLKNYSKKKDLAQLKLISTYLIAKYDNFALERCLDLAGLT